jgi:uncharacterized protein involved in exopolysaccharide biosynthesis
MNPQELRKAASVSQLRELHKLYGARLTAIEARQAAIEADNKLLSARVSELEARLRNRNGVATFPDGSRIMLSISDAHGGGAN